MTIWFVSPRGAIRTERGILKFHISSCLVVSILDPTLRYVYTATVLTVVYLLRVPPVF